ncbi:pyruvate kinase [compost metagenome]
MLYYRHHTRVTDPNYVSKEKDNDNVIMMGCRLARDLRVKAIIGVTTSGYTAFRLSHHRPKSQIYIVTGNEKLLCQLSLYWGVNAFSQSDLENADNELILIDEANKFIEKKGLLLKGDKFINMSSYPLGKQHRTNNLTLMTV